MRYDGTNLEEVLEEHEKYLDSGKNKDSVEHLRADFSNTEIFNINFVNKNLMGANFEGARIGVCNFINSFIDNANFKDCNFFVVRFIESSLENASFVNADFSNVTFYYSFCERADFSGVEESEVQIINTGMSNAISPPFIPLACPEEGSFIGWKKCASEIGNVIVKLLIPEDAKRSSATGRKCRADKAVVLDIQTIYGKHYPGVAYSAYIENYLKYTNRFEYRIGETVKTEEPFEENRFEECASGIHFFITRQEAVNY